MNSVEMLIKPEGNFSCKTLLRASRWNNFPPLWKNLWLSLSQKRNSHDIIIQWHGNRHYHEVAHTNFKFPATDKEVSVLLCYNFFFFFFCSPLLVEIVTNYSFSLCSCFQGVVILLMPNPSLAFCPRNFTFFRLKDINTFQFT